MLLLYSNLFLSRPLHCSFGSSNRDLGLFFMAKLVHHRPLFLYSNLGSLQTSTASSQKLCFFRDLSFFIATFFLRNTSFSVFTGTLFTFQTRDLCFFIVTCVLRFLKYICLFLTETWVSETIASLQGPSPRLLLYGNLVYITDLCVFIAQVLHRPQLLLYGKMVSSQTSASLWRLGISIDTCISPFSSQHQFLRLYRNFFYISDPRPLLLYSNMLLPHTNCCKAVKQRP